MAQTQISDVVVPAEFTAYQVENSMVSTALFQSGVAVPNGEMASQLQAGAQQFTVPFWSDIADIEADITNDNPAILPTAQKIAASSMVVRKSFLHSSWSEMSLASELSGSEALVRVQNRVQAYWDRQFEKRLVATMLGILYSNVANNSGDMVNDIHAATGTVTLSHGAQQPQRFPTLYRLTTVLPATHPLANAPFSQDVESLDTAKSSNSLIRSH